MRATIVTFFVFLTFSLSAQDIHFSQFGRSYLNLNPSLTGSFNANYRLNGNYKNQWSSVSEPFKTFSFSAEAKSLIKPISNIHFGLLFYNDEAGLGGLKTTGGMLSIAHSFGLNRDSSLIFKSGIQVGATIRSINFDVFSFGKQYNGTKYDPSIDNGESFNQDSYTNPNLNAGISIEYRIAKNKRLEGGLSVYNLIGGNQSFQGSNIPLDERLTIYTRLNFDLSGRLDILPAIMFSNQGKYHEFVYGTDFRIRLNDNIYKNENVYLGLWYRNKDALIASMAIDYRVFQVGLSYDINTSGLEVASNNKGGLELSFTYIIRTYNPKVKRFVACPDFF